MGILSNISGKEAAEHRRELAGQRGRAIRLGIAAVAGGADRGPAPARPAGFRVRAVRTDPHPRRGDPDGDPATPVARDGRTPGGGRGAHPAARRHDLPHGDLRRLLGAAQGVIMMALLATFLPEHLQRLNALKNVLAMLINGVAAILFIAVAPVAWTPAILLAIGAIVVGRSAQSSDVDSQQESCAWRSWCSARSWAFAS